MNLVTINRFYLKSLFKKCLSLGAYFWLLFLPAWVLFLILQVNLDDPSLANFPPPLPPVESFFDAHALGFVVVWILFQAVLYVLPVGKVSNTVIRWSCSRMIVKFRRCMYVCCYSILYECRTQILL